MTYETARATVIAAATALYPDGGPFQPSLIARGRGNYQAVITGPQGEVDGNGVGEEAALLALAANLSPADAAALSQQVRRRELERQRAEWAAGVADADAEIARIDAAEEAERTR